MKSKKRDERSIKEVARDRALKWTIMGVIVIIAFLWPGREIFFENTLSSVKTVLICGAGLVAMYFLIAFKEKEFEEIKRSKEYVMEILSVSDYRKVDPIRNNSEFVVDLKNRAYFYARLNSDKEVSICIFVSYCGEDRFLHFEDIDTVQFIHKYELAK